MNKITELLDAVVDVTTNLRNLANSLQTVAEVLTGIKNAETSETKAVEQIPEKTTKQKKEKTKTYKLEDVRGVLAEKSQNGYTAEVKALIEKYGGSKLSDIDPSQYAAVIEDAGVIGNE